MGRLQKNEVRVHLDIFQVSCVITCALSPQGKGEGKVDTSGWDGSGLWTCPTLRSLLPAPQAQPAAAFTLSLHRHSLA